MRNSAWASIVAASFLLSVNTGFAVAETLSPKTMDEIPQKPGDEEKEAAKAALERRPHFDEPRAQLQAPSEEGQERKTLGDDERSHRHGQTAMTRDRISTTAERK